MIATNMFARRLLLLWACGFLGLLPSCGMGSPIERGEQAASMLTSSVTISTSVVTQAAPPITEPATLQASETPTMAVVATPLPTSLPTTTVLAPTATTTLPPASGTAEPSAALPFAPTLTAFNPLLAFMGRTTGDRYDEVALYDTAAEELMVVAQEIENETFNTPLWSPAGDVLAFVQSNAFIGLYYPDDHRLDMVELAPPVLSVSQESDVGMALRGWSSDGNWLAYQYLSTYDMSYGASFLLNRHTGESYPLSFPEPITWLEWSPDALRAAGISNDSIYIKEWPTSTEPLPPETTTQYQRPYHDIHDVAWHPSEPGLLVSTRNERVLTSNYLWYLDLVSGKWTQIGEYPVIVAMAYSPDSNEIAISTTNYATEEDQVVILDSPSFATRMQIELPRGGPLFDPIEWLEEDVLALNAGDNVYVLSLRTLEANWVLDSDDNPLRKAYRSAYINDWQ